MEPAMSRRLRLGDLLLQSGLLSEQQLHVALQEQKRTGAKLGQTILELGYLDEEQMLDALARQLGLQRIGLRRYPFDEVLVQRLPESIARRFRAIPLREEGGQLLLGMTDPLDLYAIDELTRLLRQPLTLAVVSERELLDCFDRLYRRTGEIASLAGQLDEDLDAADFDFGGLQQDTSDAPVVRLLQMLFEDAVQMKASDIHIEPDERVLRIRQRIDGVLSEQVIKEARIAAALVMRLKIMAGLDISEKRLPQDGRFNIRVKHHELDVRISTMPVQYGESVVLRLLDHTAGLLDLGQLGMPARLLERFRTLLRRPHGIVLVTGPTGSGKTTTLYAGLAGLNSAEKKIITVEDPVEYRLPRISQVQVNPRIELTFGRVLRAAMRQDPDILLVGEIRDQETAEIALRAALTGHLVLSTLHTNDAMTSPLRLLDMGAEPFLVANALNAVLSQRLVRRVCEHCSEEQVPTGQELQWLEAIHGETLANRRFLHGRGCHLCHGTGYLGRIGIYELLEIDSILSSCLRRNDPQGFIDAAHAQAGFHPLAASALDYALAGVTSIDEVLRVTATLSDE